MKTFYTWLLAQDHRKDPVGDIARDIKRDEDLPEKKTKHSLLNYLLYTTNASFDAIKAFNQAWEEYKTFRESL